MKFSQRLLFLSFVLVLGFVMNGASPSFASADKAISENSKASFTTTVDGESIGHADLTVTVNNRPTDLQTALSYFSERPVSARSITLEIDGKSYEVGDASASITHSALAINDLNIDPPDEVNQWEMTVSAVTNRKIIQFTYSDELLDESSMLSLHSDGANLHPHLLKISRDGVEIDASDFSALLSDSSLEVVGLDLNVEGHPVSAHHATVRIDESKITIDHAREAVADADSVWGGKIHLKNDEGTFIIEFETVVLLNMYIAKFTDGALSAMSEPITINGKTRDFPVSLPDTAQALADSVDGELHASYQYIIGGFSAQLTPTGADELSRHPDIEYIVPSRSVAHLNQNPNSEQVNPPSWGLDRVDQRDWVGGLNDDVYQYGFKGYGVHVYVMDTGIDQSTPDFGVRLSYGYNAISQTNQNTNDCYGSKHGVSVAGIIGGENHGIAKGVTLHPVKITCFTTVNVNTALIGLNWVVADIFSKGHPAVVNMSFNFENINFDVEIFENEIINTFYNEDVVYVTGAGNKQDIDACVYSPARLEEVITVGGSTILDRRLRFKLTLDSGSSFGPCVDLFAPGFEIPTVCGPSTYCEQDGTSFAAPHVAGIAALYLQQFPNWSSTQVKNAILITASANKLLPTSLGTGSPNLLAYWNGTAYTHCEPDVILWQNTVDNIVVDAIYDPITGLCSPGLSFQDGFVSNNKFYFPARFLGSCDTGVWDWGEYACWLGDAPPFTQAIELDGFFYYEE